MAGSVIRVHNLSQASIYHTEVDFAIGWYQLHGLRRRYPKVELRERDERYDALGRLTERAARRSHRGGLQPPHFHAQSKHLIDPGAR
jgi:hypothetical protein